eukprot:TRINITY_DN340_c0_g1_i1.p1 TRINITY_DN340_c0_g1~~TRINITY_DN340_c0_g1_i1.p1  ORF type:complete len:251 (+),score=112.15 TRINITY_DN340_c0_g1_i1:68-754(+)
MQNQHDNKTTLNEKASETLSSVQETTKDAAEHSKGLLDTVLSSATAIKDQLVEGAKHAVDTAVHVAEGAVGLASGTITAAAEQTKELSGKALETGGELLKDAAGLAESGKRTAEEALEKGKDVASEAASDAADTLKKQPAKKQKLDNSVAKPIEEKTAAAGEKIAKSAEELKDAALEKKCDLEKDLKSTKDSAEKKLAEEPVTSTGEHKSWAAVVADGAPASTGTPAQ